MGNLKYPAHNIGNIATIKNMNATKYDFCRSDSKAHTSKAKLKGAARISIQSGIGLGVAQYLQSILKKVFSTKVS